MEEFIMPTYNFGAGPAVLPRPVLEKVQEELLDYHGSKMSILEISHRSPLFNEIYHSAKTELLKLMNLDDNAYDVLFLQGGATLQFTMVPLNLAINHHRVAYANTGHWAWRAIEEARKIPNLQVDEVTTADQKIKNIPAIPQLPQDKYDYLHITTNNTIYGTAYQQLPITDVPLVGDLSSNFLAQEYQFDQFDLMYAGAQKNLAPAGLTIVILKKDLLTTTNLPSMLNYSALAKKDSALNTPAVFQIYVADLVLKWIEDRGGVAAMDELNRKKAAVVYDFLDDSKLFNNNVNPADRSLTNVTFTTGNQDLDKLFCDQAAANDLLGVKGHRLVGGMRASLYNAMSYEGAVALRDFMAKFEREH